MVLSLPVAPRILTPLLVGKMLVPALQIPVRRPGRHDPTGCGGRRHVCGTQVTASRVGQGGVDNMYLALGTTEGRHAVILCPR